MFQIKGNKIVEAVENKLRVFDPQLADKNFGDGDVFYTADDVFYADLENMFDENADGLTRQDAIQLGFKLKENPNNKDNPYLYIPKDSRLKVSSISGPSGWPEVEFNGEDYMLAGDAFGIYYKEDECVESKSVKESHGDDDYMHDVAAERVINGLFDKLEGEHPEWFIKNKHDESCVKLQYKSAFIKELRQAYVNEFGNTKGLRDLVDNYADYIGVQESCKSVKEAYVIKSDYYKANPYVKAYSDKTGKKTGYLGAGGRSWVPVDSDMIMKFDSEDEAKAAAKKYVYAKYKPQVVKYSETEESCKSVKEGIYDNNPQAIIEETANQFVDRLPNLILQFIKESPLNAQYEKLAPNAQQDIPYSVVEKIQEILNSGEIVK